MMKEAIENMEEVIRVGGVLIKGIKYADDHGMVTNTEAGLQSLMNSLNTPAKHYIYRSLFTKYMVARYRIGTILNKVQINNNKVRR